MRRSASPPSAAPESALARLLEVESRLEAMLADARTDADAILARARARAAARAEALVAELAAADAELSVTLGAEAEKRIATERAALATVQARYAAVDEPRHAELTAWVVEQVLRAAAEPAS